MTREAPPQIQRSGSASRWAESSCPASAGRSWSAIAAVLVTLALVFPPVVSRPAAQASIVQITSPQGRIASTGPVRIVAQLRVSTESTPESDVDAVRFYVDDQFVGEDLEGPVYAVQWADKNPFAAVTIRAEAVRADLAVGVDSVTLPPLDITDESRSRQRADGRLGARRARPLRARTDARAFPVFEDGTSQTIELIDAALGADHAHAAGRHEQQHVVPLRLRAARRRAGSRSSMKPSDQMVRAPVRLRARADDRSDDRSQRGRQRDRTLKSGAAPRSPTRFCPPPSDGARRRPAHLRAVHRRLRRAQPAASSTQAMEAVRQLHGTLYTVGINGAAGMSINGREALKQLCRSAPAARRSSRRATKNLPSSHDRVSSDVASRYLLTYTPTNQ